MAKKISEHKLTILIIIFAVAGFFWNSPISPFNFPLAKLTDPRTKAFRQIVKLIPPQASVAAHTNLVPHLTHRPNIYMTGKEPFLVDYVVSDGQDVFGFNNQANFDKYLDSYRQSNQYEIILIDSRYFILKRQIQ